MENIYNSTTNNVKHDTDWYFSEEGRIAYEQADSIPQKIEYFYNYLISIFDAREKTYKLACVLAAGVANSSLSFSQYPEILSKKANPFMKHYIKEGFLGDEYDACDLITCLHKKAEYPNKKPEADSGYEEWVSLQMPEDKDTEDIYKIERLIIWLFGEFVANEELIDEPVLKYYPYAIDDGPLNYNDPDDEESDDDADY